MESAPSTGVSQDPQCTATNIQTEYTEDLWQVTTSAHWLYSEASTLLQYMVIFFIKLLSGGHSFVTNSVSLGKNEALLLRATNDHNVSIGGLELFSTTRKKIQFST